MLEIAPKVKDDIGEITEWIGQDSPARAVTFVESVLQIMGRIALTPGQFRLRPKLARVPGLPWSGDTPFFFERRRPECVWSA